MNKKNAQPQKIQPGTSKIQPNYSTSRPTEKSTVVDWGASQFIRRTFDGQPMRLIGADTCNSWQLANAKDSARTMRRALAKHKRKVKKQGGQTI